MKVVKVVVDAVTVVEVVEVQVQVNDGASRALSVVSGVPTPLRSISGRGWHLWFSQCCFYNTMYMMFNGVKRIGQHAMGSDYLEERSLLGLSTSSKKGAIQAVFSHLCKP